MNIKIKFKKSGIIISVPTFIDKDNVLRFEKSFNPEPWNEREWNDLYLQWLRGEISDEEYVIASIVDGASVDFIDETFGREGNLDIIEILGDKDE